MDDAGEYLLDDIWVELERVPLPIKLRVTQLIREYGDACAAAAVREAKKDLS